MATSCPEIKIKEWDNNGDPAVGYKLYAYESGTTTPLDTYVDADGTTPNTNPVILDSRGEATIYLGSRAYTFVLTDPNDATIWTRDDVSGPAEAMETPITVDTVAEMKALTGLADGTKIFTSGFTAAGDGGHAEYLYYTNPPGTDDAVQYHDQTTGGGQFELQVQNSTLNALAGGVRISPTDSSTAVLACITAANTNGWKLVFPGLSFKFTAVSTVPCEIECLDGFLVTPAASGDVAALRFNGTASSTNYQLTGSVSRFARSLTATASAADIVEGNLFILQDNTTRASDGATEINMEVHRAGVVSGATINLIDYVRADKSAASTNIYRITPCQNIIIRGWNFEALSGSIANSGLFFDMCENVRVYGVKGRSTASDAVSFRRCYDVAVYDWDFAEPRSTSSGQGYGLAFAKGTVKIHVGAGKAAGMRHSVDFDSCWDITSDWFDSFEAVNSDVMLAHNGWGGDVQSMNVRARGGSFQSVYVSLPATAGATAYTKTCPNLRVCVDAEMPAVNGAIGFQSEQPIIDSDIEVKTIHGDGSKPTAFASGVYGVRIPADKSKGSRIKVNSRGASAAVFRNTASAGFGDAIFDVTAANCYHATYFNDSTEYNIERIDADNIHDQVFKYDGTATLRKINIGPIYGKNLNAALTNIPAARLSATGVVGRVGPVFDDQSDAAGITMSASSTLTIDQILKARDGRTVLLTAAGAVTVAGSFIEQGFYDGQEVVLITDQTANTITITNSARMINDGAASVVLGTAKRSVTYQYSVIAGAWYQVA